MTRQLITLSGLLLVYAMLLVPFSAYMKDRPVALKLGYLPEAEAMRVLAADQRYLLGQMAVDRVLFYYGSLFMQERKGKGIQTTPEYLNMFATLQKALKLDPYNMDAYYFAQAAFTWELGRIKEVNNLLEYGMKYRTWDAQLPFYAGFNAAYFQKDYRTGSLYLQKAASLSGNPLYTTLAARYFYEAGQNSLGIAFLTGMEKTAKDVKIKTIYRLRREALQAMQQISEAVSGYLAAHHQLPPDLAALVSSGFLKVVPPDPYGGKFYLDGTGKVRSTSPLKAPLKE
jgi:hypothetical protein